MRTSLLLLSVLAALGVQCLAQECARNFQCADCISTAGCVWCTDRGFDGVRCMSKAVANTSSCVDFENPPGSIGVESTPISASTNPISLSNINLDLRVGEPLTFNVNVTALRNLPLDLYILMDLSSSMGPVLRNVQTVSGQIIDSVRDVTDNVRLGFGSFSDKNTLPFTSFVESRDIDGDTCTPPPAADCTEAPYTFLHRSDFTDNITLFSKIVDDARVTENIDGAENVLEALAQVVATECESILGWRSRNETVVTRLVLVLTDQGFHYSGDGKLAGILNPYRGECLLSEENQRVEFTRFDEVDYPSVGQIVNLLRLRDVTVIFSVVDMVAPTYQELVDLISEKFRASVTSLNPTGGAQEIIDTIEREYRRILQEIRLVSTDTTGQVSVSISPTCPTNATELAGGDGCDDVVLDDSVMFSVTVTLNSCDGLENDASKTLTLESPGFGSFTVTYTGVCNCGCENSQVPNSVLCSEKGNLTCGVCVCNEGYCGSNCNLTVTATTGADSCPRGGVTFSNEICSGRGVCNCECECDDNTFGEACQCDTFSTQCKVNPDDTEVCSARGTCCNRACVCQNSPQGNQYRGTSILNVCQCEPEEEVCFYNGVLCNGVSGSSCQCDRCSCPNDFGGNFCERPLTQLCPAEFDSTCIRMCRIEYQGQEIPDYCRVCNENRPVVFIDMSETVTNPTESLEVHANRVLGTDRSNPDEVLEFITECSATILECENELYLLGNTTHIVVVVEREVVCATAGVQLLIPVWAIAIIILGVLLILGILIIILAKIIVVILDYIEVTRWQKEAREADFSKNQNPLYQSPEMKYENIAYGKE